MHPCVPGIGGKSFHLHFLSDCHLKQKYHDRTLLWERNETSSKQQCSHHNISQRTSYIFALEIGTLHVDRCSGDGGGFFSKGADGLLCSCADDGKLRFFGADVVPQLEPMIVMDGMTLDRFR